MRLQRFNQSFNQIQKGSETTNIWLLFKDSLAFYAHAQYFRISLEHAL